MSRFVFVSYKFTDRELAHTAKNFFQAQGGECQGSARYVEEDVADEGDSAIDRLIRDTMKDCAAVLAAVGNDNHNSWWINREMELAVSLGLPIVAVRVPGTTGGIPNLLKDRPLEILPWGQDALCRVLNAAGK